MSELILSIDGIEVCGHPGQTILELAHKAGVPIPTLCHDERVATYGACGICVVEVEGIPKLLRACSTMASDGMQVTTNSTRIFESRKTTLELLLSDHTGDCLAPCKLACPGHTDCQGYVGLIANGAYKEALELIKDKIPFPASIGRVCPHPCEDACRRQLVEEPIAIAHLKQYVGDLDLQQEQLYTHEVGQSTGRRIAVIGGGPGGLSAAYFARTIGHDVTVYESMPHMGGMLRYGIPEYRLPKSLLQREIDAIEQMGVSFHNNTRIGQDISLSQLNEEYDAVLVAVGAWSSTAMRCPGEDKAHVLGGIDFLRDVILGQAPDFTDQKVAIVGGGNTAMDACRTAVRLGAKTVYNIYRRTKQEMPAEEIEIIEAEEEGVVFKYLTNPIEILGETQVESMRLQIMELGEADESGRRRPVPVEGQEEVLDVDYVIIAIGQKLAPSGMEEIHTTRWGTIAADQHNFRTNIEGVFAIGDATNDGADIAISAIGDAKRAIDMVDRYLNGEELTYQEPYLVRTEKTADDLRDRTREARQKMSHRPSCERRSDFKEVNLGLTEEQAIAEANRCLECGCMDVFECKLIEYANQYNVNPSQYDGRKNHTAVTEQHPFILRNPDKCILCGLCVRYCEEVPTAAAIGLSDRGFDTIVKPAFDVALKDTDCVACGGCVTVCPTGALVERMMTSKQVPLEETYTNSVCTLCEANCKVKIASRGSLVTRTLPRGDRDILCQEGRFGFPEEKGFAHLEVSKDFEKILIDKIKKQNVGSI